MLTDLVDNILLNVAVWLWVAAALVLFFLARGKRWRLAVALVFLALFWISGTGPFAHLVLRPLENAYPLPSLSALQAQGVQHVVVLTGGGYPPNAELDALALPHASTFRFLAGVELCRKLPNCQVIFSGSAGSDDPSVQAAGTMQRLSKTLAPDLPTQSESKSVDTSEHPANVKPLVGNAPFALVTSAYHMPRAMLVFERAGLHAIPYPVDYYTHAGVTWTDLIPSPDHWVAENLALHEYVGILDYTFRK